MSDPKNFDEFYNGDRAFILGGGTFHWRPIHWREWGELLDKQSAEEYAESKARKERIDALMAANPDMEAIDAEYEIDEQIDQENTTVESFQKVINRICEYLEPEEIKVFKETVNDKSKRISVQMLNGLMVWLQGVQTPDRPTETPLPSSSSPGSTGATSPAA